MQQYCTELGADHVPRSRPGLGLWAGVTPQAAGDESASGTVVLGLPGER